MNGSATRQEEDGLQILLSEARTLSRWGLAVILVAVVPIFTWTSLAQLASAVVAPAYVKVDLNRRPVQHAEGGIVREVLVRDGQDVKKGEPLLVLGDVSVDADKIRLRQRVATERAGLARLEAEQALATTIAFAPDLIEAARNDPRITEQLAKERGLFVARREALVSQVGLLRTQREKVGDEITALQAQIAKANESMRYQKTELENNRKLLQEGYISAARISQLDGTVADYGVKIEERRSELARSHQRMVDTDLRIRALESDYRQQSSEQLKATLARLSELEQEQRKSVDASLRQVITAPASGKIIDLKYSTPGTVVPPRQTIADIVPEDTRLLTEARIRTEDINRIHQDQAAEIRFTAFKYRTTHLVRGKVVYISADRLIDPASNAPYYSVLVEADTASLASMGDLKLVAGMPAE
ncbi:MAG: HlyD family type I secretion periplasmic adaptor subunit, partial [Ramlibacter sp.]